MNYLLQSFPLKLYTELLNLPKQINNTLKIVTSLYHFVRNYPMFCLCYLSNVFGLCMFG